MNVLSPHLREQKYGRRTVTFSLEDAVVVASPPANDESASQYTLRTIDGTTLPLDAKHWNIPLAEGDVITQVLVAPAKPARRNLGAILNRSQRERRQTRTLSAVLRRAKVSRALSWWWSVVFLIVAAVVTDYGFFARKIAATLKPVEDGLSGPVAPYIEFISRPLEAVMNWLPLSLLPGWPSTASGAFGSLQDHSAIFFFAALMLILILGSRTFRLITVPIFAICFFILKTRLFGFDSAQGTVLLWYAPALTLLIVFGSVNRMRDRWRMAARLAAISKSQMSQPIPHGLAETLSSATKREPLVSDPGEKPSAPIKKVRPKKPKAKKKIKKPKRLSGETALDTAPLHNTLPRRRSRRRRR